MTIAVAQILRVFLDGGDTPQYGYELTRQTELPSGRIYPILARLEANGWLVREAKGAGRQTRALYRLSPAAAANAPGWLADLRASISPRSTS